MHEHLSVNKICSIPRTLTIAQNSERNLKEKYNHEASIHASDMADGKRVYTRINPKVSNTSVFDIHREYFF